jgi:hypothetical protein
VVLLLVAGSAQGAIIKAPPPPAGDGPAFQRYIDEWFEGQLRHEFAFTRSLGSWDRSPRGSRARGRHAKRVTRAARAIRAIQKQVRRDPGSTGFGIGCKRSWLFTMEPSALAFLRAAAEVRQGNRESASREVDNALDLVNRVRPQRSYKMARCLDRQGWVVPPIPVTNSERVIGVADALYLEQADYDPAGHGAAPERAEGAGNQLIRSGGLALAESLLEDQANQLAAPGQAERRVTVKPHPGSFRVSCELW